LVIVYFRTFIEENKTPGEKKMQFFFETLASSENTVNLCVTGLLTGTKYPIFLLNFPYPISWQQFIHFNLYSYPSLPENQSRFFSNACGRTINLYPLKSTCMKFLYPSPKLNVFVFSFLIKTVLAVLILVAAFCSVANAQTIMQQLTTQSSTQELVFKNGVLQSGTDGADNAVYRFPSVLAGIDGLIKINGRSSSMVRLVTIDLTTTGYDKAFQPQVTYGSDNTSPAGNSEWWMEFQITFVQSNTNTPVSVNSFDVTGLDIDGNNDKINEFQTYYGLKSYTLESNTALTVSTIQQTVNGVLTNVAKRFDGPIKTCDGIDTSVTADMTTCSYALTNSFKMRTGAKSSGVSGAADRMYSLWFKSFVYDQAVSSFLPVTLINWNASYANDNVALKWTTTVEKNASHFIIERSFDGAEYSDIAMLFATGNSDISTDYAYNDKVPAGNSGIIYYRLKMVDMDGNYKTSDIRVVRMGKSVDGVKIIAYPNPVVNDVRITIPQNWQGKQLNYQLANTNGQIIKSYKVQNANQTEVISMSQVPAGMYVMRVINGSETAVQSVVKAAR
jgi:Secretion system C-terminal sorting domain